MEVASVSWHRKDHHVRWELARELAAFYARCLKYNQTALGGKALAILTITTRGQLSLADLLSTEVEGILKCFRDRQLHAGDMIQWPDFGDMIVWEAGFVRDEPVRQALRILFENGYLLEMSAAVQLTKRGEEYIYSAAR